ncbi:MAG: EamA family transporter [Flavobacteriaceae bacterium]|nr:EamA family transporter [Flavobacteriaceae bacterium]
MKNLPLTLSVLAVAIIYGTSFLGIRLAVETIPPLYVTGIRHCLAAIILFIYLFFAKQLQWIGWKNLKIQLILSTFILIMTNGLTTIAQEHITSSLASLISACTPILVFIGSVALKMQSFTLKSLIGVLLGFAGIVFIFWDGLADLTNPEYRKGMFYLFLAISGSASGALFIKLTNYKNNNIPLNLCYQFAFAGVVQIITAILTNTAFEPQKWSNQSVISMLALTIFASITAYLAYTYALTQISAVKVSLISYVNTIIAIFLGWLIADEPVNANFIISTIMIILGIFITNYKPEMFKRNSVR